MHSVKINNKNYYEFEYGPLLLASYTHYNKECELSNGELDNITVLPCDNYLAHLLVSGVHLVDYASAGKNSDDDRYCVWIDNKDNLK